MKVLRRLLFWAAYLTVSLGLVLGVLEILARRGWFAPRIESGSGTATQASEEYVPLELSDKRLGVRPNPKFPSHDARGWRNEQALEEAEIVALGDSQTYGINVLSSEAWPQVIGRRLNRVTYQMAFGGYSAAHYVQLFDEVLARKPKVLLMTYYFGNDNLDSYWLVYNQVGRVDAEVVHSFKSQDSDLGRQIAMAESIDPGHVRHKYLDCQSQREPPTPEFQAVKDVLSLEPLLSRRILLWAKLQEKSRLFANVGAAYDSRMKAREIKWGKPLCISYRGSRISTEFSPGYRLLTLTRTDPRVVEGASLTRASLAYLAQRAKELGIAPYVVLIPTKEAVFQAEAAPSLAGEEYLSDQWLEERFWRDEALRFLGERGVPVVESLPELAALVAEGKNPYHELSGNSRVDADGHPTQLGYAAIAEAVTRRLEQDGWKKN